MFVIRAVQPIARFHPFRYPSPPSQNTVTKWIVVPPKLSLYSVQRLRATWNISDLPEQLCQLSGSNRGKSDFRELLFLPLSLSLGLFPYHLTQKIRERFVGRSTDWKMKLALSKLLERIVHRSLSSLFLCRNNNLDFFTRDINLYFSCYVYSNSPEQKYFLSGHVLVLFYWRKRSLWEIYLRVSERSKSSSKLNDIEHRPPSSRYTKPSSRSSKSTDVNFER